MNTNTPHGPKETAQDKATRDGGLPEQEQQPPGLTTDMTPVPDHGEETWTGRDRLKGRTALITGGDSGIGRAVAIAFAREGCDVAISYLPQEQSDADDVAAWVEKAGRRCILLPGDLTDEKTARGAVDDAVAQLGGLDILVNNASMGQARERARGSDHRRDGPGLQDQSLRPVLGHPAGAWRHGRGIQHHQRQLDPGLRPFGPADRLAATKAAINNFTVNLAAELGPRGIRVNAVAPGPIWTPLQPATREPSTIPGFGEDTPLGRPGQPAELAGAFVFLASDLEASYVSGTVLGVTGGRPVF